MRLERVEIHSIKAEETAVFFQKMGAKVTKENELFKVQVGSSVLTIIPSDKHWSYHIAFNIPFDQVENAAQWLSKFVDIQPFQGEKIVEFPNWEARAIYFYDPSGNILELIGRKPFCIKSKSTFDFDSFLNISELGWPVENVNSAQQQFPLPVYSQFGEYFAALGDEEGLFIVVDAQEKDWIPNDDPTEFSPCSAVVHQGSDKFRVERAAGVHSFTIEKA